MQKISAGKFHFEPPFTSFDHLVGKREQLGRDFDAQCLCGGEVDDQIEFGPKFDRQVAGLFAFENPADVDTSAAISIRLTWAVAHPAGSRSVIAYTIHRRQRMKSRQAHEQKALPPQDY